MPKTRSTTATAKTKSVTTTKPKPPTTATPKPYTGKRQTKQTPKSTKSVSNDSKKTTIEPINLEINCIVEGEEASFPVEIRSNRSVGNLKKAIHDEKKNTLSSLDPNQLVLYLIPNGGATKKGLEKLPKDSFIPLDEELDPLYTRFPAAVDKTRIHIIVQLPQKGKKRDRDEDTGLPSKKSRTRTDVDDRVHTIEDAVRKAKLRKALVDGEADLALLILEERAKVLSYVGNTARNSDYYTISAVARNHRKSKAEIHDLDVISAPAGSKFPVIEKKELYVRDEYKTLYDDLVTRLRDTEDTEENMSNRIIVTGTPGIGKSAFLVYFAIRLLSEYKGDEPPIVIYHSKWGTTCYAFGGDSIVRTGERGVFKSFLDLPETWYLIDSSPVFELSRSRTIFSASSRALEDTLKEVVKQGPLFYHMAPWELEELERLRTIVSGFHSVPPELLIDLYIKIGGVPRYVLETPALTLSGKRFGGDIEMVEREAYDHVKKAIEYVKDPALQHFTPVAQEQSPRLLSEMGVSTYHGRSN